MGWLKQSAVSAAAHVANGRLARSLAARSKSEVHSVRVHGWTFLDIFRYLLDILHIVVWQQSRNVAFEQSRNVVSISERSLPFPLARIVLLATEPVKDPLRRAQNRRAALTEPAASQGPNLPNMREWELLESDAGDISTLPEGRHFYFALTLQ